MQRKWFYFLLVMFVLFLIWQNADGTGQDANAFFGWLGDILDRGFEFLDSLFGDTGGGTEAPDDTQTT